MGETERRPFTRALILGFVALALGACATQEGVDRRVSEQLAAYHTTCLKRGLAIDTAEHTACVEALYENDQRRLARLRGMVMPQESSEGGTTVKARPGSDQ